MQKDTKEFLTKFRDLLKEYDVELEVDTDESGYHISVRGIAVCMNTQYEKKQRGLSEVIDITRQYEEITFSQYLDFKDIDEVLDGT